MRRFLKNAGFSLAEVLVVLGILGGVSLVVAQLMKQSATSANYAEARTEENEIARQIGLLLSKKDACTNSLAGKGSGETVNELKNIQNSTVFNLNGTYGGGAITISGMRLTETGTPIPAEGRGTMFVEVDLRRRKVKAGSDTFTKKIMVGVKLDASSKIEACSLTEEGLTETAAEDLCLASGGTWIPGDPGICEYTDCDTISTTRLVSTQCLNEKAVMKAGDTMTGSLTLSSGDVNVSNGNVNLGAGGRLCINGICRDYTRQSCAEGLVVIAVNEDGTLDCAPANSGNNNCIGAWSQCTAMCGGGTETYVIYQPQLPGGNPCPHANGEVRACNTSACVNCQGSWSACSASCGGGTRTYNVTQAAGPGGAACPAADGTTEPCNTHQCLYSCPNVATSGCYRWTKVASTCTSGSTTTTCYSYSCNKTCQTQYGSSTCSGTSTSSSCSYRTQGGNPPTASASSAATVTINCNGNTVSCTPQ
jgi:prepilin-type N-terminal cleavage/methylation domain-containing protein